MRAENRFNWRLLSLILIFIALFAFFLPFADINLSGNKVKSIRTDNLTTFERTYSGFKFITGTDDKITGIAKDGSTVALKTRIPVKRDSFVIFAFLAGCLFVFFYTIRSGRRPLILGTLSLGGGILLFLHSINASTSLIPTVADMLSYTKLDKVFTIDDLARASKTGITTGHGIGFYIAAGAFLVAAVLCFTGKETERSLRPILNYDNYGYYFVLPFIIIYSLFSLYPIIYSFYISLTDMSLMRTDGKDTQFIGIQNYADFLQNKNDSLSTFVGSFKTTWIIWLFNFIPQIGLALLLAVWFTDLRLKLKGTGVLKTLYYMPNIITQASVAVLFNALFLFRGPINLLMVKQFDFIPEAFDYLKNEAWAKGVVAFIQTWLWYGNTLILIIAGMMGISPTYYEAAMVDGATTGKMFTHVTLPNLRPLLKYVLVTSLIGGMQMFDIPYMLTDNNGGPNGAIRTMTVYLYQIGFKGNNSYARAAVIAVAMFVVIMACNIILNMLMKDREPKVARRRVKA